jgi:hypothetical protein
VEHYYSAHPLHLHAFAPVEVRPPHLHTAPIPSAKSATTGSTTVATSFILVTITSGSSLLMNSRSPISFGSILYQNSRDAAVDLIARVFKIPIPDAQRAEAARALEQVASGHHTNGFDS